MTVISGAATSIGDGDLPPMDIGDGLRDGEYIFATAVVIFGLSLSFVKSVIVPKGLHKERSYAT